MPKYCPTCNRSSAELRFYGSFCEECSRKKFSEALADSIEITRCKECLKIRVKGQFTAENDNSLEKAVQQLFRKQDIKLMGRSPKEVLVYISEDTGDGRLSVEKRIKLKHVKALCERCYKIKCNYYEAMFQLRGDSSRISKVIRHVEALFERNNEFISKMESKDGGIDLYLSSKRLASEFVAYYKLYPKMSYTLSWQDRSGKKVYKNTYAIHL